MRPFRGRRSGLPPRARSGGSEAEAGIRSARCRPGLQAVRRTRGRSRPRGRPACSRFGGQPGLSAGGAIGAVGGVGHYGWRRHAPAGQCVEPVQRQMPLLPARDLGRDAGEDLAAGVRGPLLGHEQPPLQRAGCGPSRLTTAGQRGRPQPAVAGLVRLRAVAGRAVSFGWTAYASERSKPPLQHTVTRQCLGCRFSEPARRPRSRRTPLSRSAPHWRPRSCPAPRSGFPSCRSPSPPYTDRRHPR